MILRLYSLVTTFLIALTAPFTGHTHEGAEAGHAHGALKSDFQITYEKAVEELDKGAFHKAQKLLTPLANSNPFHPQWAHAHGLLAYTHYQQSQYKELQQTLMALRAKQPQHPVVPYVLYLNGLVNFERMKNVTHDQSYTKAALRNFMELRQQFSETPYAEAALPKIDAAIEQLAGKELEVARHYQQNQQFLAAIKRLETVVNVFSESEQVPEALFRLWENYSSLGLVDEAQAYAANLQTQHRESAWAGRLL